MSKQVTNEELARMMAKGFENTATKEDLTREISSVREDLEEIKLKFEHFAHKFEVKDLEKRVTKLEQKIGVK